MAFCTRNNFLNECESRDELFHIILSRVDLLLGITIISVLLLVNSLHDGHLVAALKCDVTTCHCVTKYPFLSSLCTESLDTLSTPSVVKRQMPNHC